MIKARKVNRDLLPIQSFLYIYATSPLPFVPFNFTCLIYHPYHLVFAFHLLPPLHNLIHQPQHLIYNYDQCKYICIPPVTSMLKLITMQAHWRCSVYRYSVYYNYMLALLIMHIWWTDRYCENQLHNYNIIRIIYIRPQ